MRMMLTVAACMSFPALASAQVVAEMTPELIERAIKEGQRKPKGGLFAAMSKSGPGFRHLGASCYIATPYIRVVRAANKAFTEYKPFTAADVTPDMIAPEVSINCGPRQRNGREQGARAIAMTRAGSREPIAALRTFSFDQDLPAEISYRWGSVTALYPPAAITPAHEIHVIYAGDDDVRVKLDGLKDLR